MLGAFVTLVSIPMAALLLVAMFTVHLPYGFSSIKLVAVTPAGAQFGPPGYECNLLYLASFRLSAISKKRHSSLPLLRNKAARIGGLWRA
jgi:uncharacterized membrane protein YphA (DoxX/SURF4 family)